MASGAGGDPPPLLDDDAMVADLLNVPPAAVPSAKAKAKTKAKEKKPNQQSKKHLSHFRALELVWCEATSATTGTADFY